MRKLFLLTLVFCGIFSLTGCYNRDTGNFEQFPDINNLPSGVVDQAGLTDEDRRRQLEFLKSLDEQQEPVYRINAGDKISIRVYNHPDLIMESLVTPDGAIGVMFAGQVQVAGLTLVEASEKIKKIYGILKSEAVREMFARLEISSLPISKKQQLITWLYKRRLAIGLLCMYYERR
jgi:hypothetical protein